MREDYSSICGTQIGTASAVEVPRPTLAAHMKQIQSELEALGHSQQRLNDLAARVGGQCPKQSGASVVGEQPVSADIVSMLGDLTTTLRRRSHEIGQLIGHIERAIE